MTAARLRRATAGPAAGLEPLRDPDGRAAISFEAAPVLARLRLVLAGDVAAAAWLYDTFAPRLYRRLRRRYGYPGGLDADDLLHDAFVYFFQRSGAALRRIVDRSAPGELTPEGLERRLWDLACGIAANRRRAAARRRGTALTERVILASAPQGERQAVSRDLLQRLDACLRGSRPKVYLYFKLRYWDGLLPNEIAAATGWSPQATYKLKEDLNAALAECAACLGIRLP